MRRLGILLVLMPVVLSAVAPVVRAESPGFMSFYFDEEAMIYQIDANTGPLTIYVCLTEAPFASVQGYEFQYEIFGTPMLMDLTSRGDGAVVADGSGGYRVDLQQPLAVEPVTVLAELRIFIVEYTPAYLKLSGLDTNPWTELDLPAVILPDGTTQPVCTAAWDSALQEPVYCASINDPITVLLDKSYECYGIVSSEEMTWDAVKSMYR